MDDDRIICLVEEERLLRRFTIRLYGEGKNSISKRLLAAVVFCEIAKKYDMGTYSDTVRDRISRYNMDKIKGNTQIYISFLYKREQDKLGFFRELEDFLGKI